MTIGKIGPAFPAEEWINSDDPSAVNPIRHQGMTLRDYFAAKAMQSYVAHNQAYDFDDIAAMSYRTADAMLKARQA
jgi:hypothetical protein